MKEKILKFIEDFQTISEYQIYKNFKDSEKILNELIEEEKIFKKEIDGMTFFTTKKEEITIPILEPFLSKEKIKENCNIV